MRNWARLAWRPSPTLWNWCESVSVLDLMVLVFPQGGWCCHAGWFLLNPSKELRWLPVTVARTKYDTVLCHILIGVRSSVFCSPIQWLRFSAVRKFINGCKSGVLKKKGFLASLRLVVECLVSARETKIRFFLSCMCKFTYPRIPQKKLCSKNS